MSRAATSDASGRASRTAESRTVVDDRRNLDPVRGMSFASELFAEQLPNLPDNDEYHYYWASTTHTSMPPQRFIRAGYEVVTTAMLPAMKHLAVDSPEFGSGAITQNEMIALRVRRDAWQATMKDLHHDQPAEKVRGIVAPVRQMIDQYGIRKESDIGSGTQELLAEAANQPPAPVFDD